MQGTNAYVSQASYTPYGEASQLVMGVNDQTLALTINRDAKTRLTSDVTLTGQLASPQLEKMSYTYDLAGNLKKLVNVQGSASTGPVQTQCFHYDNLRQVDDAWASTDSCATNPTTLGTTPRSAALSPTGPAGPTTTPGTASSRSSTGWGLRRARRRPTP